MSLWLSTRSPSALIMEMPSRPLPITAASLKLYEISSFSHFLLSKQVFRTVKYAATLLANMKVCPGTPNSHIMGKCVLTNHRHGILALKTRRTRSVCSFIIICFFWLVGANIKTILFKFVNISPNHSN